MEVLDQDNMSIFSKNAWHKGAQKGAHVSQYVLQILQKSEKDQWKDLQAYIVHVLIYYIVS